MEEKEQLWMAYVREAEIREIISKLEMRSVPWYEDKMCKLSGAKMCKLYGEEKMSILYGEEKMSILYEDGKRRTEDFNGLMIDWMREPYAHEMGRMKNGEKWAHLQSSVGACPRNAVAYYAQFRGSSPGPP